MLHKTVEPFSRVPTMPSAVRQIKTASDRLWLQPDVIDQSLALNNYYSINIWMKNYYLFIYSSFDYSCWFLFIILIFTIIRYSIDLFVHYNILLLFSLIIWLDILNSFCILILFIISHNHVTLECFVDNLLFQLYWNRCVPYL